MGWHRLDIRCEAIRRDFGLFPHLIAEFVNHEGETKAQLDDDHAEENEEEIPDQMDQEGAIEANGVRRNRGQILRHHSSPFWRGGTWLAKGRATEGHGCRNPYDGIWTRLHAVSRLFILIATYSSLIPPQPPARRYRSTRR